MLKRRESIAGKVFGCALLAAAAWLQGVTASAQSSVASAGPSCTTQAVMQQAEFAALTDAALGLGADVKAGDTAAVKAATIAAYATNFSAIEYAVRDTSAKLAGDTLRVTQVYGLDASGRKAGDMSEAEFSCPLKDSTSEVDFSIDSLPPGQYGFAMVEAAGGSRPWLLAFLLQREGGMWKMAGFYPHARTAAGHDGLWYWQTARERVKAGQTWLAWLDYGEADALLRPANFVTSTNLDGLRSEQRSAAPPALADGVSTATPLVVTGAKGEAFRFTSMTSEDARDDESLHLVLHYATTALSDTTASRARNLAAAEALIDAHPEIRLGYSEVLVFGDVLQQNPSVLELTMGEIK